MKRVMNEKIYRNENTFFTLNNHIFEHSQLILTDIEFKMCLPENFLQNACTVLIDS